MNGGVLGSLNLLSKGFIFFAWVLNLMKRLILLGGLIFLVFSMGCTQQQNKCNYTKIEVYFYYHPDCIHCKRVEPYIDSLRKNYTNVTFYYCNVQNLSKVCYEYRYYVIGVPTVVVHTDNVTASLVGERDVMKLEELIKGLACCEK